MLSDIRLHSPKSLREVFGLLKRLENPHLLAGGTDLLVDIKEGVLEAPHVISLKRIKELRGIHEEEGSIRIGALVTAREIAESPLLAKRFPALREAAASMGSPQIRATATIGGNISSAVPSADLPQPLIAADASVELRCAEASRKVFLFEFYTGPRITICQAEEVLVAVLIPQCPPQTGIAYKKFSRREANSLAVASAAARVRLDGGKIRDAAVVLGAVAPTPVLAVKASEFLIGKAPSEKVFGEAGRLAKDECRPISDVRGSAWLRKELIGVLVRRVLEEAADRARKRAPGKS